MDLYCSTVFIKVEHTQNTVKWSTFGWRGKGEKEFPAEIDLFNEDYSFEFDKKAYYSVLEEFKVGIKISFDKPKMYCLSGLGVDHRAFINFNPKQVELTHVPWIPIKKGESLKVYAKRLFKSMDVPEEYYLVGLSFGGMLAQEIAQLQAPKALFLISTSSNLKSINPFLIFLAKLGLHKILPSVFFQKSNGLTEWFFGTKSKKSKLVLKDILADTNTVFVRRAISAIVHWNGIKNIDAKRIHGCSDRLILRCEKADLRFTKEGHLLILERGKEVSNFVDDIIINSH